MKEAQKVPLVYCTCIEHELLCRHVQTDVYVLNTYANMSVASVCAV